MRASLDAARQGASSVSAINTSNHPTTKNSAVTSVRRSAATNRLRGGNRGHRGDARRPCLMHRGLEMGGEARNAVGTKSNPDPKAGPWTAFSR